MDAAETRRGATLPTLLSAILAASPPRREPSTVVIVMNAEQQTSDLDIETATDQVWRPRRRGMRSFLVALTLGAALIGCGSSTSDVYDATRSASSLQSAGWKAEPVDGMPNTIAGVQQEGYLETTAPDGTRIDVQFLEDGGKATQELNAVMAQYPTFLGVTIGNSLIFAADPATSVPAADLEVLSTLLR